MTRNIEHSDRTGEFFVEGDLFRDEVVGVAWKKPPKPYFKKPHYLDEYFLFYSYPLALKPGFKPFVRLYGLDHSKCGITPQSGVLTRVTGKYIKHPQGHLSRVFPGLPVIDITDIEPIDFTHCFSVGMSFKEVLDRYIEKNGFDNGNEIYGKALLLEPLNAASYHPVGGGVATYLSTPVDSKIRESLKETLYKIVPPCQRGNESSSFIFLDIDNMFKDKHRTTYLKRHTKEESYLLIENTKRVPDGWKMMFDFLIHVNKELSSYKHIHKDFDNRFELNTMMWTLILRQVSFPGALISSGDMKKIINGANKWIEGAIKGIPLMEDLYEIIGPLMFDVKGKLGTFLHVVFSLMRTGMYSLDRAIDDATFTLNYLISQFCERKYPRSRRKRNEYIEEQKQLLGTVGNFFGTDGLPTFTNKQEWFFDLYSSLVYRSKDNGYGFTLDEALLIGFELGVSPQTVEWLLRVGDLRMHFYELDPGIFKFSADLW
ncbi:MAG: hypothetical protein ACFFD4_15925 [Candidatus Odinarchaeota archaeon]